MGDLEHTAQLKGGPFELERKASEEKLSKWLHNVARQWSRISKCTTENVTQVANCATSEGGSKQDSCKKTTTRRKVHFEGGVGRRPQSAVGSVSSQHSLTLKVNTTVACGSTTLQREVCLDARSWSKDQSCSRFHNDTVGISASFPTERAGDRKNKKQKKKKSGRHSPFSCRRPSLSPCPSLALLRCCGSSGGAGRRGWPG